MKLIRVFAPALLVAALFWASPASADCFRDANNRTNSCVAVDGYLTNGTPTPVDNDHPLPVTVLSGGGGGGGDASAANQVTGNASLANIDANTKAGTVGPTSFRQTTTTSAAALSNHAYVSGVVIKALTSNTGTVYIGVSGVTTSTGYPLAAGEAISYSVNNSNLIYIIGSDNSQVVAVTGN